MTAPNPEEIDRVPGGFYLLCDSIIRLFRHDEVREGMEAGILEVFMIQGVGKSGRGGLSGERNYGILGRGVWGL